MDMEFKWISKTLENLEKNIDLIHINIQNDDIESVFGYLIRPMIEKFTNLYLMVYDINYLFARKLDNLKTLQNNINQENLEYYNEFGHNIEDVGTGFEIERLEEELGVYRNDPCPYLKIKKISKEGNFVALSWLIPFTKKTNILNLEAGLSDSFVEKLRIVNDISNNYLHDNLYFLINAKFDREKAKKSILTLLSEIKKYINEIKESKELRGEGFYYLGFMGCNPELDR